MNIGEIINSESFKQKKSPRGGQRAATIEEIYQIYISENQRIFRKKANWQRYCSWLRDNRISNSLDNQNKFRKTKLFIKEHERRGFAVMLAPMKQSDLFYILSMAKDMENRNQNFSGYIMANMLNRVHKFDN